MIRRLVILYYKIAYGININLDKSMMPETGIGKSVSVIRKGDYLDIVYEKTGDFVRLVPYQPNHGIMVENWENGKLQWRRNLDYRQLKKEIIFTTNVDLLAKK